MSKGVSHLSGSTKTWLETFHIFAYCGLVGNPHLAAKKTFFCSKNGVPLFSHGNPLGICWKILSRPRSLRAKPKRQDAGASAELPSAGSSGHQAGQCRRGWARGGVGAALSARGGLSGGFCVWVVVFLVVVVFLPKRTSSCACFVFFFFGGGRGGFAF